jgi:hypothetical protein
VAGLTFAVSARLLCYNQRFPAAKYRVFWLFGVLLKRAALFFAVLCAGLWTACGGGKNNSGQVSNIKDRALFDNNYSGAVNILDIDQNPPQLYGTTVAALTSPKQMLLAPDRSFVLIYDDSAYNLTFFSSSQETTSATLPLNYHSESIVMSADGKHAYAAVPDNPESSAPPGAVLTFDLTTGTSGIQIPVPGARRLALSGDGNTLLVFSDASNSLYYVNLSATTITPVEVPGFNQPYTAYFSSDNKTAYVLNCGLECSGGASPSVQPLAISSTPTPGSAIPVPGATVGLLNGTTLYVAGNDVTKPAGSQGVFSTVNLSSGAVTSVAIPDGLHTLIASYNNAYWLGSTNCTATSTASGPANYCMAVVDSSGKVHVTGTSGNVTAFTPAPKKKWMYVMQGGELYQYDPTTFTSTEPYVIVGVGWDIKLLDQ